MSRTRWLVVLGFMVALAAGAVLGVAQDRARHRAGEGSWLAAQLNLSEEQQEQIRQVWAEAMPRAGREHREAREALQRERDTRVREMLTEEQRAEFDAILAEHEEKLKGLSEERSRAVEAAQERTRQLLTEPQRAKYEELLRDREHWPKHGDRRGPHDPKPETSPDKASPAEGGR